MSTFITQQRQIQRINLSAHTNNANPFFVRELNGLAQSFRSMGMGAADASHRAIAQLSSQMDLQASVLAFKNAFWILGALVIFLTPLPFIMKRPSAKESEAAAAAH